MLKPIFNQLWWLVPLLFATAIAKTPWFKGIFGEFLVRLSARLMLDSKAYLSLHNVTLNTPDGTTQIDHIFVSQFGIFVVETKNYGGWIFGGEHQANWTQKLFKITNKFQNPLRQNYKHIKALESLTGLPTEVFHSVIVFVGGSTFKTPMPSNVTFAGGFISFIKSKVEPVISTSEVEHAYSTIEAGRLMPSIATNRLHVENVQRRTASETPRVCPKCGASMVLRTVKSGDKAGNKFWGCSAFPKCRTLQKVS